MKRINATKLLIKELPRVDKVTSGGLIIPGSVVKDPSAIGVVVMVGKGIPSLPTDDIPIGAKVLYSPHAIQRVAIPDDDRTADIDIKGEFFQLDVKDVLLCWTSNPDIPG